MRTVRSVASTGPIRLGCQLGRIGPFFLSVAVIHIHTCPTLQQAKKGRVENQKIPGKTQETRFGHTIPTKCQKPGIRGAKNQASPNWIDEALLVSRSCLPASVEADRTTRNEADGSQSLDRRLLALQIALVFSLDACRWWLRIQPLKLMSDGTSFSGCSGRLIMLISVSIVTAKQ